MTFDVGHNKMGYAVFCFVVFLHYPECSQQCSNPDKYVFYFQGNCHFIWSHVSDVISPLCPLVAECQLLRRSTANVTNVTKTFVVCVCHS